MPLSKVKTNSITDNAVTSTQVADNTITTDQMANTAVHGRRNLVINGGMRINQRGDATGVSGSTLYTGPDRWEIDNYGSHAMSISQSTDVPTGEGFTNSYKIDVTTSSDMSTDKYTLLNYKIEAQDLQHLEYGTANAKALTYSFWVKSNVTGKYSIEMFNQDGTTHYLWDSFNINTASTWEKKVINIPANTVGGTIDNDTGYGLFFRFWLAAGTNFTSGTTPAKTWGTAITNANRAAGNANLMSSTSNEFYLTGAQIEVGDIATPFEHRTFADELQDCKRYYYVLADGSIQSNSKLGNGYGWASGQVELVVNFPVNMRSAPTLKQASGTNKYRWASGSGTITFNNLTIYESNKDNCLIYSAGLSGVTQGRGYRAHLNDDSDGYVAFDAEL